MTTNIFLSGKSASQISALSESRLRLELAVFFMVMKKPYEERQICGMFTTKHNEGLRTCMDGWREGGMDGAMDKYIYTYIHTCNIYIHTYVYIYIYSYMHVYL